jgi:DNA repair protein RecO (recombination protein O)
MEFTERVLVLQLGKFKEADLWVRFLSPTRGLLTAFAFGGSRSRRRFVGCLDLFNEISVQVASSKRGGYLALREGVLIKGLSRLRNDWPRFGLAVNCVRFLQSFGVGPEGAGASHALMRQTIALLEEGHDIPSLLPLFFRLRLAIDQGYALESGVCPRCRTDLRRDAAFMLVRDGRIVCRRCKSITDGAALLLGLEALEALSAIAVLPPTEWGSLGLSPGGAREFARAVDGFIQYHVGISWEQGRFVRV